jgi:DNA-binding XRE family transcriptional regulator
VEFDKLSRAVQDELLASLVPLRKYGPSLGRPYVDTLNDSNYANMKELRFKADGGVWRVAFAFDPQRDAILLVAGDKSGVSEKKFYKRLITKAGERYKEYLDDLSSRGVIGMRGMVSVDDVIAALPKNRQKAIKARGNELLAKIDRRMTLSEMRKGRKISQAKMAKALGIDQTQISRLEKRNDPRLSTIERTVAAMGGHLTMIATFPDQEPVILMASRFTGRKAPASTRKAKAGGERRGTRSRA